MARPRTSKKEVAEPTSKAEQLIASLKASYPGLIYTGTEYTSPWLLRRYPTGLLSLDIALNGGFPAGGLSILTGQPSIGKSDLAYRTAARQQELRGEESAICVVASENAFDKSQLRLCGIRVALNDLEVEAYKQAKAKFGETVSEEEEADLRTQIGTVMVVPPTNAETLFAITIDVVASRQFNLVIFDSFGSLSRKADLEKAVGDDYRLGGGATLNQHFMDRLNQVMGPDSTGMPNLTGVIGVNQVRENTDRSNPNSPKTREAGGYSLKHGRWVTVELTRTGWDNDKANSAVRLGKTVQWRIERQKAGGQEGAAAKYDYIMGSGPDFALDTLNTCVRLGVIQKNGNTYSYQGSVLAPEDKLGIGMDNTAAFIGQDPEVLAMFYTEALRAAGIRCNY